LYVWQGKKQDREKIKMFKKNSWEWWGLQSVETSSPEICPTGKKGRF